MLIPIIIVPLDGGAMIEVVRGEVIGKKPEISF
jgi:hypothetical protein